MRQSMNCTQGNFEVKRWEGSVTTNEQTALTLIYLKLGQTDVYR